MQVHFSKPSKTKCFTKFYYIEMMIVGHYIPYINLEIASHYTGSGCSCLNIFEILIIGIEHAMQPKYRQIQDLPHLVFV